MNFSLVSCLVALAGISLVYAAECDLEKNDCEVGCCMMLPPPRRPRPPPFGIVEDMMKDIVDKMPPLIEGFIDEFPGPHQHGPWRRPKMNGTCVLGDVGSDCMMCREASTTASPDIVNPSTDESTTDSSSTNNNSMNAPKWWPRPHHHRKRFPCCSCNSGLTCNRRTKKCQLESTVNSSTAETPSTTVAPSTTEDPATTVSTAAP